MATGRLPDPNTAPVTAKGDLYTYSTVPAKLAVGNNGETLVADSSASTGLRWQGNFAAGKNAIINGDFRIWQRGTSFSSLGAGYTADRFTFDRGGSSVLPTISQQTFTPGTAPVAGYEGATFYRYNQATAGTGQSYLILCEQRIEDVRAFAGQTVTFSVWVKADASRNLQMVIAQAFGSGGSSYNLIAAENKTASTSWQRISATVAIPSISGKTIGTGSYLQVAIYGANLNTAQTIDLWGMQIEAGNTATAFQTATGTLAGELAACMRYYQKSYDLSLAPADTGSNGIRTGFFGAAVTAARQLQTTLPVRMRTAPTVTYYSNSTGASGNVRNVSTAADIAVSSQGAIGESSLGFPTLASAPVASDAYSFHYVASAEL